jgi:hypothetical protein
LAKAEWKLKPELPGQLALVGAVAPAAGSYRAGGLTAWA